MLKNKIIAFIMVLSIFCFNTVNVLASEVYPSNTTFAFSGIRPLYLSGRFDINNIVTYDGSLTLDIGYYNIINVYNPNGWISRDGITYYYMLRNYNTNSDVPTNVGSSVGCISTRELGVCLPLSASPIGNFPIYSFTGTTSNFWNNPLPITLTEYTPPLSPEPPILVKIFDVIVNSNAYQSISKLGKWVRDSVTDALTFEPVGSLISVNIGDTITVTDSNNTVTTIPTSYVLPSVTYNGGNTSVNINTNKIVDYMGKDEVTFQSIKYDITYEYIDESDSVVNETYTYNYNYNDKEIVYGPQEDPTANNSTDDTTITVNQPQGSQNVENSTGALGSVISSIASIFVGAINGLLGGIATIVGSLTNLITNTGGFFDAIGGVIAPFYQNTILGSIVNILAIGLFATFIIGFFKK